MARPKKNFIQALRDEVPDKSALLVACSGGLDSVSLLHGLALLAGPKQLRIEVAHIDHGLRFNSADDAEFVRNLAAFHGFQFHLKEADDSPSSNIEAWGRGVRYRFFREIVHHRRLDWAVTAHTASDVAETFLIRLLNNKEPRTILKRDLARAVIRPLLSVTRREVMRYAQAEGIEWREDPSNGDNSFLRNRVRNELIPFLEARFDTGVEETLCERALVAAEDFQLLDEMITPALNELERLPFGSAAWLNRFLMAQNEVPPVLGWRLVAAILKPALGFTLGREHCHRASAFMLSTMTDGSRRTLELPGSFSLVSSGKTFELRRAVGNPRYLNGDLSQSANLASKGELKQAP